MSCHDYEGVMLVLCTPLQVKCYRLRLGVSQLCSIQFSLCFNSSLCFLISPFLFLNTLLLITHYTFLSTFLVASGTQSNTLKK